jgi:hypothetical protein
MAGVSRVLADGSVTAAKLAAGVGGAKAGSVFVNSAVSTTSTSYADVTGLSVSITPSTNTKKVLIIANLMLGGSAFIDLSIRLMRDATAIALDSGSLYTLQYLIENNGRAFPVPISFLDAPATTSAVTYKVQWKVDGNTAYLNRRGLDATVRGTSTLSVIETS